MTLDALLPLPPAGFDVTSHYRLKPRPKRAFHTILDANKLLVLGSKGSFAFRNLDGPAHPSSSWSSTSSGQRSVQIASRRTGLTPLARRR